MSALLLSDQCRDGFVKVLGVEWYEDADHEACPGGHTIPGVMGGWTCSCPCHREAPVSPRPDQEEQ